MFMKKLTFVLAAAAFAAGAIAAQKTKPASSAAAPASAAPSPAPASAAPAAKSPATAPASGEKSAATTAPAPAPAKAAASASTPAAAAIEGDAAAPEPRSAPIISSEIGGRDLLFLTNALQHGEVQLYLGKLAKDRAMTEQLKAVGAVLASNQDEENKKVARLATMKGVSLAASESALKKKLAEKLEPLTGPKFDKTLMEEIVAINQAAVANYEQAQITKDEDIKAFVEDGLPNAKEKLLLANKMSGNSQRTDKVPGFRTQSAAPAVQ